MSQDDEEHDDEHRIEILNLITKFGEPVLLNSDPHSSIPSSQELSMNRPGVSNGQMIFPNFPTIERDSGNFPLICANSLC